MCERQCGQALPLGLALILFAVVTGLTVFDTGTAAVSRTRLANAADAAAYGGLQPQARALNFAAYTNRAMVANQVAIAQAVSLRSWATYARVAAGNLDSVLAPVPYLGALAQAAQATLSQLERLLQPAADGLLRLSDQANAGIALAQEAMFTSAHGRTPVIVRSVAQANDSRFTVNSALALAGQADNLRRFASFTTRHDATDIQAARQRVALIEASLDDFTKQRRWRSFDGGLPLGGVSLQREGQTRLLTEATAAGLRVEWKAKDTLSLQAAVPGLGGSPVAELPIGWSEASVSADPASGSRTGCLSGEPVAGGRVADGRLSQWSAVAGPCKSWFEHNRLAEALASQGIPGLSGTGSSRSRTTYHGLHAFRTLADGQDPAADPRLELMVEVSLPADRPAAGTRRFNLRRWLPDQAHGRPVMSALSVAELYYRRPDHRSTAPLEAANAYNPYWSVRLAPVTDRLRRAARAARRGGPR